MVVTRGAHLRQDGKVAVTPEAVDRQGQPSGSARLDLPTTNSCPALAQLGPSPILAQPPTPRTIKTRAAAAAAAAAASSSAHHKGTIQAPPNQGSGRSQAACQAGSAGSYNGNVVSPGSRPWGNPNENVATSNASNMSMQQSPGPNELGLHTSSLHSVSSPVLQGAISLATPPPRPTALLERSLSGSIVYETSPDPAKAFGAYSQALASMNANSHGFTEVHTRSHVWSPHPSATATAGDVKQNDGLTALSLEQMCSLGSYVLQDGQQLPSQQTDAAPHLSSDMLDRQIEMNRGRGRSYTNTSITSAMAQIHSPVPHTPPISGSGPVPDRIVMPTHFNETRPGFRGGRVHSMPGTHLSLLMTQAVNSPGYTAQTVPYNPSLPRSGFVSPTESTSSSTGRTRRVTGGGGGEVLSASRLRQLTYSEQSSTPPSAWRGDHNRIGSSGGAFQNADSSFESILDRSMSADGGSLVGQRAPSTATSLSRTSSFSGEFDLSFSASSSADATRSPSTSGSTSTAASKKKTKATFTDEFRMSVIAYREKYPEKTQLHVALKFGIDRSTVSKILTNREAISERKRINSETGGSIGGADAARSRTQSADSVAFANALAASPMGDTSNIVTKHATKPKSPRQPRKLKYAELEKRLLIWIQSELSQTRTEPTREMIRTEAARLAKELPGTEDFRASNSWTDNFRARCGLIIKSSKNSAPSTPSTTMTDTGFSQFSQDASGDFLRSRSTSSAGPPPLSAGGSSSSGFHSNFSDVGFLSSLATASRVLINTSSTGQTPASISSHSTQDLSSFDLQVRSPIGVEADQGMVSLHGSSDAYRGLGLTVDTGYLPVGQSQEVVQDVLMVETNDISAPQAVEASPSLLSASNSEQVGFNHSLSQPALSNMGSRHTFETHETPVLGASTSLPLGFDHVTSHTTPTSASKRHYDAMSGTRSPIDEDLLSQSHAAFLFGNIPSMTLESSTPFQFPTRSTSTNATESGGADTGGWQMANSAAAYQSSGQIPARSVSVFGATPHQAQTTQNHRRYRTVSLQTRHDHHQHQLPSSTSNHAINSYSMQALSLDARSGPASSTSEPTMLGLHPSRGSIAETGEERERGGENDDIQRTVPAKRRKAVQSNSDAKLSASGVPRGHGAAQATQQYLQNNMHNSDLGAWVENQTNLQRQGLQATLGESQEVASDHRAPASEATSMSLSPDEVESAARSVGILLEKVRKDPSALRPEQIRELCELRSCVLANTATTGAAASAIAVIAPHTMHGEIATSTPPRISLSGLTASTFTSPATVGGLHLSNLGEMILPGDSFADSGGSAVGLAVGGRREHELSSTPATPEMMLSTGQGAQH